MEMIQPKLRVLVLCTYVCLAHTVTLSETLETFTVSLQGDGSWSIDQWIKYKNKIENVDKELTICHWENIRFFSEAVNSVWAYCYIKSKNEKDLECWQLYSAANRGSAGRNLDWIVTTSFASIIANNIPYKHREWNHVCFTYSSIKKAAKLYVNGELLNAFWQGDFRTIESGKSVLNSSFIIGQEPDKFNGGYDSAQLFNGELSELNVWGKELSEIDVKDLATCSKDIKGNIIAWEKHNFIISQAEVKGQDDNSQFCSDSNTLVVFPEKRSYNDARSLCDIHGGQLVVPFSKRNEEDIMNILKMHESSCLSFSNELQDDKAVWLGMERQDKKWYIPNANNQLRPINYTNWNSSYCTREECGPSNLSCPYMLKDGLWAFGLHWGSCSTTKLCTICSFTEVPIFTLKGVCSKNANLDWNYYFTLNETSQIVGYDGFKTSNLSLKNGTWSIQDNEAFAETLSEHPIGRREWSYKDNSCGIKSLVEKTLTFSRCHFGKEFTCNSGQCVDMSDRCNQMNDCDDASDEDMCDLVHIPKSYNKLHPPLTNFDEKNSPVNLSTQVNIISIDDIDPLHMQVGITFETQHKWSDSRLNFENLDVKGVNPISAETAEKLWLPSDFIIHDNAILGKIVEDSHRELGIENLTTAMPGNIMKSIENYVHLGSNTRLVLTQRFKIAYTCVFKVEKFPFDKHECHFIMKLRVKNANSVVFTKDDPAILYQGSDTVNQFKIDNIASKTWNNLKSTNFVFSIQIHHNVMNQVLGTFVPTVLLWALAYFTHFIDVDHFSDRFIGAVTTLLVLVSLLNAKNEELPKTSYFKFIDLWFLWHISSIFAITVFHIFTNHITNEKGRNAKMVTQRGKANRLGAVFFAIIAIVFDIIYFLLSV